MHTPSQLSTSKVYVWFIAAIENRTIKGKQTLIIDWECKQTNVTVREYLRICSPFVDSRLYNTMKQLGWDEQKDANITPQQFFAKGLHIKAKPLMYWSELNSEDMKWKLNYETLEPMKEKIPTMRPEDIESLKRICSARKDHNEVLGFLATHHVDWIEPFLVLSKEGVLKFKT